MPTSIRRWPTVFGPEQDLLIVAIDTPDTPIRDTARQLVRGLLREILGDIELISLPGQPIRLAHPEKQLGISVSHERGLSLLAIHRSGPVGIDLLGIAENPAWQGEIPNLARDYLGQQAARRIAGAPKHEEMAQFAQEWTANEARLKCLGLGLIEWNTGLETDFSMCHAQKLDLPPGYIGSVAILKSAETRGA